MSTPIEKRGRGLHVFLALREMAIAYQMKPGERINEYELAEQLGVSRTPIREALARLASEGLLMESTRGYIRKPLNVEEMADLYEARLAVERECLRLACTRATQEELQALANYLHATEETPADACIESLVELDESFHIQLATLSGNAELTRMLIALNEKLRFIRWIDMENVGRHSTQCEHQQIITALLTGQFEQALHTLDTHISKRRERIVETVTQGLAKIYLHEDTPTRF